MCSCRCFGSQCVGSSGLILVWYVYVVMDAGFTCEWSAFAPIPVDIPSRQRLCCDGVYQGLKVDSLLWLRIRGDKRMSRLRCSNFNAVGLRCGYGAVGQAGGGWTAASFYKRGFGTVPSPSSQ